MPLNPFALHLRTEWYVWNKDKWEFNHLSNLSFKPRPAFDKVSRQWFKVAAIQFGLKVTAIEQKPI